jgi:cellulose synthase/poly-beta-1,6-N-acetylglucosamine synthase-like glycosyltransferase
MYSLEINLTQLHRRFWEILPGALSWGTLLSLTILSFIIPFWISIFVIVYDTYIFIRAATISFNLIHAYRRLKQLRSVNWLRKAQSVTGALTCAQINHLIVLPTYNESLEVLRTSLTALTRVDFPLQQLHVVVGFEERIGAAAQTKAAALTQEFAHFFGTFLTTFHPDNLPGEKRVKSANATWAVKKLEALLTAKHIPVEHILVSNFDSDTVVNPNYFAYLTYIFLIKPNRYRLSYQPLPMYHNNIWDAPSFSRVIETSSTFWYMIESTRPERLVTFSSHSMTLQALKEVGYWQKDIISEDSRIFWQCFLHYNGDYQTEPLYTTVSMDVGLGENWWKTVVGQYRQKRRWAWGVENLPYVALGLIGNHHVSLSKKFRSFWRLLEGHYMWATSSIVIAGLGWLPLFFGGPEFHSTALSFNLPFVTRTIMTIAMSGLVLSGILSYKLLPPKPAWVSRWRYFSFTWQWALVPFIAVFLFSAPALDAETRLLLGRDLQFNVMEKHRKRAHA